MPEINYLNINLLPYEKKESLPDGVATVLLIADGEQVARYPFQQSLVQRIERAFSEKRAKIVTVLGDRQTFVAIAPERDAEPMRRVGASLYAALQKQKTRTARIRGMSHLAEGERLALLEGLLLASYHFDKYKSKKKATAVDVYVRSGAIPEDKLDRLKTLVEAVSLAKTLVNEPVNHLDALRFAEEAAAAGKRFGFTVETLHKPQIEELKMGGLLAVNKGSETPPTFNIFRYEPANAVNERPLVLVGKGVMFDTRSRRAA